MKESQLENKTEIATNDYVRMVDENNNSVKIKKDSFMAAIRDALPSIISDGATGGGSVLSIINGALKTRTDANLASVLGVSKKEKTFIADLDTTLESGCYRVNPQTLNLPSDWEQRDYGQVMVFNSVYYISQFIQTTAGVNYSRMVITEASGNKITTAWIRLG